LIRVGLFGDAICVRAKQANQDERCRIGDEERIDEQLMCARSKRVGREDAILALKSLSSISCASNVPVDVFNSDSIADMRMDCARV
jgi:hypothetical protein